jgi:hypothetical protein
MGQITIEPGEKNYKEIQELLGIKARDKIHVVFLQKREYKKDEKENADAYVPEYLPARVGFAIKGTWKLKDSENEEWKEKFTTNENQSIMDVIKEFNDSRREDQNERFFVCVIKEKYIKSKVVN